MAAYDLNTAKQKVTDYTTQKFGRGPQNDTEWGAIAQGINYDDGVDDLELGQAYGNADKYAASLGAPQAPGGAPPPSVAPTSNVAPGQGMTSPNLSSNLPPISQAYGQQQQAPASPIQSAFQSSLMNVMNRAQQTPSLSDPTLAPQVDVFRAAQQRSAERQRGSAAERLAQQGFTSGGSGPALDLEVGKIENQRGMNEAGFEAGLIGNEMKARRQELQHAMTLAGATGDQEMQRALSRELATLDVALREKGVGLNERLGLGDLGLRGQAINQQGMLGRGDLALRLQALMQGNTQFYDQLGLGAGQWLADYNQRAFQNYMGGFGG